MTVTLSGKRVLAIALFAGLASAPAMANDPTDQVAEKINEKFEMNIKRLFSTKCSWCHQGFGMKQADGPKLAGTSKTLEQVMKHIKDGKSPMPSFKSQLTDKEIQALGEYIKGLPGD